MLNKFILSALFLVITNISAQTKYEGYFLEFWDDFNNNYAYFEKQQINWNKVKEIYLPLAKQIEDDETFIHLLEQVTYELHNGHISLNVGYPDSNKIIPSGQDIFAVKAENRFFVSDVLKNSPAEKSGIIPNMEIIAYNGESISKALTKFLPKYAFQYNDAMYSFALNMLLAGTHRNNREITVISNGTTKVLHPDKFKSESENLKLLEYKILNGNVGYIKINNSLGNNNLIIEFDKVLDSLSNTNSIILDLTLTPGGGNTTVARAIMGRFTDKALPYQMHRIDEKEYGTLRSWIEYVSPRKNIYTKKLIVMVSHWTGSMGEGIAIGFDGMERAKIVGTKMAGLLGAIYNFKISNTSIGFQFPVESLYHINGMPREDFLPEFITANTAETYLKALELAK